MLRIARREARGEACCKFSLWTSRENQPCRQHDFRLLANSENLHFCCFMPPILWQFVTAAPRNKHSCTQHTSFYCILQALRFFYKLKVYGYPTSWSEQVCASSLSHTWFFVTPRTVACQAPLFIGILQARILEWVVMPSSRGSSQPRDWTQVSHTTGRFFTVWATREAHEYWSG